MNLLHAERVSPPFDPETFKDVYDIIGLRNIPLGWPHQFAIETGK